MSAGHVIAGPTGSGWVGESPQPGSSDATSTIESSHGRAVRAGVPGDRLSDTLPFGFTSRAGELSSAAGEHRRAVARLRPRAGDGCVVDCRGIGRELMSQPSYRSYTMGAARLWHTPSSVAIRQLAGATALLMLLQSGAARSAIAIEVLQSVSALPPHLAGLFSEPAGFHQLRSGGYLVFDRRGHTVYGIDAAMTAATKIVQVGQETGRIIQPVAFAVSSDDRFVVADAPFGRERVQRFGSAGTRLGGFVIPGRVEVRVQYGGIVLNGVASIAYEGESILVNQPERGALITEYSLEGWPQRNIGLLRAHGS